MKSIFKGYSPECEASWSGCFDGGYDPRCCRFPKSCSAGIYEWEDDECDQTGTPTSSGYVLRSAKEPTVDEPNMDALLLKTKGLYQLVITDQLLADHLASLANVLEDFSRMKSVDPYRHTRIASLSMQNKMRLLTLVENILEVQHSTSQALNATCVENSQWQPESNVVFGQVEKKDLTLTEFRNKLWTHSRSAHLERIRKWNSK